MGTRFISTRECPAHHSFKEKIVDSSATDTVLVMKSIGNPSRVMKNQWAEKVLEMESRGASLEELGPLITGKISMTGWVEGNLEEGLYATGQIVERINDIPSVSELMKTIVGEALEVKDRLNRIL